MNGILIVDKPAGWTSFDVIAKLRGALHTRKIGHSGTLDPLATGVLPLFVGGAVKAVDLPQNHQKSYLATLRFGVHTPTGDLESEPDELRPGAVRREQLAAVLPGFLGPGEQLPPMYSAVKVNGQPLYKAARAGRQVERKARRVRILALEIHGIRLPEVSFSVTCSSGTYIRTLCQDIGERLGCGGCMKSLLRTRVDRFQVEDSLRLSEIEELAREGRIGEALIPVDEMFPVYPKLRMKEAADRLVYNGNPFSAGDAQELLQEETLCGTQVRVYDSSGNFVGIYRRQEDGQGLSYRPVKMFLPGKN